MLCCCLQMCSPLDQEFCRTEDPVLATSMTWYLVLGQAQRKNFINSF